MGEACIVLNGGTRKIEFGIDLVRMLDHFELPKQRIAIELNGSVIRRSDWAETLVSDGDRIEVVHFVGGG